MSTVCLLSVALNVGPLVVAVAIPLAALQFLLASRGA
jgi:hypothetical protein